MEVWKDIKGFEGSYQISNLGRVYSNYFNKYLKNSVDNKGYIRYNLYKNKIRFPYSGHQLVWDHFGDGERNGHIVQVDHKDENKLNNHISNLQLLTSRGNTTKYHSTQTKTSKYVGVRWKKGRTNKWCSQIYLDGKCIHLGSFENELDAHNAYQTALEKISNRDGK